MVSTLTTEAERPLYLGFVGLTWGIGTILGPIIGGAFADSSATWRWSFYINLCIGGTAAPVYLFLLPGYNPRPGIGILTRAKELDFVGGILSAGAMTTLVMAISFGGGVYRWDSGQIIGLFISTGVLWVLFILQQAFALLTTSSRRLFPVDLVRSWEMDILFSQMAIAQTLVMLPIYFIPIFFQFTKGDNAIDSGVRLLPFVLVLVFAVMLNGAMMAKLGYYMPWYLLGAIFALIGSCLLHTIDLYMSRGRVYGFSVLAALGTGLYSQAGFAVAQVKAPPQQLSQATAFIGVGQVGGIKLALALSNSILLNRATDKISYILPGAARGVIQQAISGVRASFFTTLSPSDRTRVLGAVVESIADVFIMMIAAAAVSTVLAIFMKREKLFVKLPPSNDAEATQEPSP
ncbi:efflux pump antibiotic resistance protein, putative [Talaromyces stipitatus ATCC 10500]|uniref:Efflux pump antibiotic resistance protein, putative n=1 Tax=Talaromyces stipitatus (strain ATCC 10500 / CBS 375.48 / QM 6759 / NRRL 1006) TaxID=441959 RepID=B8MN71_TALSN|nr:efflux pump antibiotic resistance protein, putative [Talaromyces stipitatus ATCC 10500]EED14520.1 efflux pump antibiotic resistance protein, putative [Talaromyces stipitatus ATCC 10500]